MFLFAYRTALQTFNGSRSYLPILRDLQALTHNEKFGAVKRDNANIVTASRHCHGVFILTALFRPLQIFEK